MLTHQKGEKNKGTASRNHQNEIIVVIVRTYSACPAGRGVIFDGFTCQRLIIIQLSLYVTEQMGFLLCLTHEGKSLTAEKQNTVKRNWRNYIFLVYFTSKDGSNQYLLQAIIGNQYFCSKIVDPTIFPTASVPNKQISFWESAKETVIDLFEPYYEGIRAHAMTLMRVIKERGFNGKEETIQVMVLLTLYGISKELQVNDYISLVPFIFE